SFDVKNPAFREWVKLSVPLMLGVSLVTADDWILRHYASSGVGDITRLTFSKRLFAVPIAVLGQATGQASLPFFARLFNEKKLKEFAATVNDSVYRVSAASFLATAWMMAAALPMIDLVYRRGKFIFPGGLRWGELGKAALTAVVAGGISLQVAKVVPLGLSAQGSRLADLSQLALV